MLSSPYTEIHPSVRLLLGPGPANVHPRVLQAMSAPVLGHLDPDVLTIMDDIKEMLRMLFRTENEVTLALSGTGSAGMEACLLDILRSWCENRSKLASRSLPLVLWQRC